MTASRFTFRLQRLLSLREKAQREAAIALATAHATEEEARRAKDALDVRKVEARGAMLPRPGHESRVAELRQVGILMEQIERRTASADEQVGAAERSVQEKQLHLGARVMDRRVLDRLKDRQRDAWRTDVDRMERDVMDEIARARYMDATETKNASND